MKRGAKITAALAISLTGIAGAAGIAYGAWMAWPPAGFVAGGALALTGAILLARAE